MRIFAPGVSALFVPRSRAAVAFFDAYYVAPPVLGFQVVGSSSRAEVFGFLAYADEVASSVIGFEVVDAPYYAAIKGFEVEAPAPALAAIIGFDASEPVKSDAEVVGFEVEDS